MKVLILLFSLFSAVTYGSSGITTVQFDVPENIQIENQNVVCESVVCNSVVEKKTVPVVGDVPPREGNKTIEILASAVYIAGEVGLAENLSDGESETYTLD